MDEKSTEIGEVS